MANVFLFKNEREFMSSLKCYYIIYERSTNAHMVCYAVSYLSRKIGHSRFLRTAYSASTTILKSFFMYSEQKWH